MSGEGKKALIVNINMLFVLCVLPIYLNFSLFSVLYRSVQYLSYSILFNPFIVAICCILSFQSLACVCRCVVEI